MTENRDSNDRRIERRQFVKAAGAGALGTTVFPTVRAEPGTRLGTTSFAEVGMETDISGLSRSDANPSIFHWDFPLPHVASESTLFVREAMSDEARDMLTTKQAVVKASGFRPASDQLFGQAERKLTHEHGPHYRRNYVVELEEGYDLPRLSVSPQNGVATIRGHGRKKIPAGSERTFELQSQNLKAELVRMTDEKVDNSEVPEHRRALKKERWTETVTVTPTLKIRNYGELEIRDATEGMVHRQ